MTTGTIHRHETRLLPTVIVPTIALGIVALVVSILIATGLGPIAIAPLDVLRSLIAPNPDNPLSQVIWQIRLPRTLLAALIGAALAVAGVVMQAVFRNPLAEPGVTGASSGAALGAITVLVLLPIGEASWPVALAAFLGSAVAMVLLLTISRSRGTSPATLILIGISLNAFAGAMIALLITNADSEASVRGVMAWLNGSLSARGWDDLGLVVLPILVGIAFLSTRMRWLDTLLLGDQTAVTLGLNPDRSRNLLLIAAALVTGAAVAASGVITFVGLVVPHAVRLVLGSSHRLLLPASILWGATFLVLADSVSRAEWFALNLQTGVVVAIIGAPVFLILILRRLHGTVS